MSFIVLFLCRRKNRFQNLCDQRSACVLVCLLSFVSFVFILQIFPARSWCSRISAREVNSSLCTLSLCMTFCFSQVEKAAQCSIVASFKRAKLDCFIVKLGRNLKQQFAQFAQFVRSVKRNGLLKRFQLCWRWQRCEI